MRHSVYTHTHCVLCCCILRQTKTFTYRYVEEELVERPFMSKFDILLRGCYLFRGMPFLRVTFIDVCKAVEFINKSPLREAVVLAKRRELLLYDSATGNPRFLNASITEPVWHLYLVIVIWYRQI